MMKHRSDEGGRAHDGERHSDRPMRRNAHGVDEDRDRDDRAAPADESEGQTDRCRENQPEREAHQASGGRAAFARRNCSAVVSFTPNRSARGFPSKAVSLIDATQLIAMRLPAGGESASSTSAATR